MCILWFWLFFCVCMHKSVVDVCVCVCEHLWLQSGLVCGCMSLASVCKESFSVWVKGGNAWSLRSDTK